MIKGKSITFKRDSPAKCDVGYREIDALNVSSIKRYDEDPILFFREFIMKQRKKGKSTVSLTIGGLVDFYLLDCGADDELFLERFDEKYTLYQGVKGMGQVFVLADALFKITEESLNYMGEIVRSFEDRFKEALEEVQKKDKYKGSSVEKAMEDFDRNGKQYFNLLMENSCKVVVEVSLVDKSKKVADILYTDPFTSDVFQVGGDEEYFPKFAVEWEYLTEAGKVIKCKSELDIFKVNHAEKRLYLKDVKTVYDNEEFKRSYLAYRYDLQAAFYYLAIEYWAKENDLSHYEIVPMEFVVGDTSINNRRPVRYQTTLTDLDAGLNGYTLSGMRYKGIHQLMEEISWSQDNDTWNCSKELFDNEGIMQLNFNYE